MAPRDPKEALDAELENYLRSIEHLTSDRPPSERAALRRQLEALWRKRLDVIDSFEVDKHDRIEHARFPLGKESTSGVHVIYTLEDDARARAVFSRMKDEADAALLRANKARRTKIVDGVVQASLVAFLIYIASMLNRIAHVLRP